MYSHREPFPVPSGLAEAVCTLFSQLSQQDLILSRAELMLFCLILLRGHTLGACPWLRGSILGMGSRKTYSAADQT